MQNTIRIMHSCKKTRIEVTLNLSYMCILILFNELFKNFMYTQKPKDYDHLSITSFSIFGLQYNCNLPWHGRHKPLVDDWRQIVIDV